jgi:hypothetical protein
MHRRSCIAIFVGAALSTMSGGSANAWGRMGHEVSALIAYHYLTPAARKKLDALLASDPDTLTAPDFASRSSWADSYRAVNRETSKWHYIDTELDRPNLGSACFGLPKLQPGQPASDGPAEDCVVNKVEEFASELRDPATPRAERLLALKFLIHFVGDIHQPLHAGDHDDRGGNCVRVEGAPGELSSNLHAFWDTTVVEHLGSSSGSVAATLGSRITPRDVAAWTQRGPSNSTTVAKAVEAWAWESFRVAKTVAYALPALPGCDRHVARVDLSPAYEARADGAAAVQLERAGVRLAWLLNQELR